MLKCELCNKEFKNYMSLSTHCRRTHNMSSKEYYDKFFKSDSEGICSICGKETTYVNINIGYLEFCSNKCAGPSRYSKSKKTNLIRFGSENVFGSEYGKNKIHDTVKTRYNVDHIWQAEEVKKKCEQIHLDNYGVKNVFQSDIIKEKIKCTNLNRIGVENPGQSIDIRNRISETIDKDISDFEVANNVVRSSYLFDLYGTGWYQSSLINELNPILYKHHNFYTQEDINKIDTYYKCHGSYVEYKVYENLTQNHIDFIHCDREIIAPKELDFYLPGVKIAIECNGYYHDLHCFTDRDQVSYHKMKYDLCSEKGIHLYFLDESNYMKELAKIISNLFTTKN